MKDNSDKLESIFRGISISPIPYIIFIDRDERDNTKIQELTDNY